MFSKRPRERGQLGEYDYGNGRRGRHPIRPHRQYAVGPPPWVRTPTVEPVEGIANESSDATHGDRDRSFESEMARLDVWE